MSEFVRVSDRETREDLRTFLERLAHVARPEVRVVARGLALAVYGCTQAPVGLLDRTATILVMRAFLLDTERVVDTVVPARALLDRLARGDGLDVPLPETTVTASWAGVLPPKSGWESAGEIDAESLRRVAEEGSERLARALPDAPGEPVVEALRRQVWGAAILPGIPAGAAFAMHTMGFLQGEERVRLDHSKQWWRLGSTRGYALVRGDVG